VKRSNFTHATNKLSAFFKHFVTALPVHFAAVEDLKIMFSPGFHMSVGKLSTEGVVVQELLKANRDSANELVSAQFFPRRSLRYQS
jgi:hypothetical protein